jgi:beta-lactam-binding protein with PASTA domain
VRKLLAVGLLLVAGTAQADFIASGFFASGFAETGFFEESTPQVAVPNVIGQADFATADGILEGDGLDGNELAPVCSSEPEFEIVRQSIAAGTLVDQGTVIDLRASNGVACPVGGGGSNRIGIGIRIGL